MLRDRERREYALMLAPYLIGIALLIALPALVTLALALTEYDLIRSPRFIGMQNFRELWNDEIFRTSIRNSLMFILFAVPLRLVGALALALLLHRKFRGVAAYRTAGYLPTVVPDVAYALLWLWIINPLYGPLNLALGTLGYPKPAWLTDPRAAQWAVIIMSLFVIGEGFIVAMATRQGIPGELYELGDVEDATPLYMLRRVTLPLMAPTLLLLMFRDTIFSFQANFVPALIITDGGPPPNATTYLPLFIYRNGFEYLRYGYASAATLVMFAMTALIVYLQYRIVKRWRHAFVV
jgi:multiple sugar transport system permease protein